MSSLIIDEPPLMVLPSLAAELGLNEAIVVQQLHYWLRTSSHMYEGRNWIYNSVTAWQEQFPFWSESTIKRILTKLCDRRIILKGNFNKMAMDRTIWYSLDYSSFQGDITIRSDCPNQSVNMTSPIPETTTETTTENKKTKQKALPFDIFWADYPRKEGKGAARAAFSKAIKKTTADTIISGLLKHPIQTDKDPKFIPHPATWLNQERWDDEPAKAKDKPYWGGVK